MLLYSPPYIEMVVQGLLRFSFHRTILGRLVSFPIQTKLDVVTYYYPFLQHKGTMFYTHVALYSQQKPMSRPDYDYDVNSALFLKTNNQTRPSYSGWSSPLFISTADFFLPASSFPFISFVQHFLGDYKFIQSVSCFATFSSNCCRRRDINKDLLISSVCLLFNVRFVAVDLSLSPTTFSLFVCNALIPSACIFFSVR